MGGGGGSSSRNRGGFLKDLSTNQLKNPNKRRKLDRGRTPLCLGLSTRFADEFDHCQQHWATNWAAHR
jgi:hypothetical protein